MSNYTIADFEKANDPDVEYMKPDPTLDNIDEDRYKKYDNPTAQSAIMQKNDTLADDLPNKIDELPNELIHLINSFNNTTKIPIKTLLEAQLLEKFENISIHRNGNFVIITNVSEEPIHIHELNPTNIKNSIGETKQLTDLEKELVIKILDICFTIENGYIFENGHLNIIIRNSFKDLFNNFKSKVLSKKPMHHVTTAGTVKTRRKLKKQTRRKLKKYKHGGNNNYFSKFSLSAAMIVLGGLTISGAISGGVIPIVICGAAICIGAILFANTAYEFGSKQYKAYKHRNRFEIKKT